MRVNETIQIINHKKEFNISTNINNNYNSIMFLLTPSRL